MSSAHVYPSPYHSAPLFMCSDMNYHSSPSPSLLSLLHTSCQPSPSLPRLILLPHLGFIPPIRCPPHFLFPHPHPPLSPSSLPFSLLSSAPLPHPPPLAPSYLTSHVPVRHARIVFTLLANPPPPSPTHLQPALVLLYPTPRLATFPGDFVTATCLSPTSLHHAMSESDFLPRADEGRDELPPPLQGSHSQGFSDLPSRTSLEPILFQESSSDSDLIRLLNVRQHSPPGSPPLSTCLIHSLCRRLLPVSAP